MLGVGHRGKRRDVRVRVMVPVDIKAKDDADGGERVERERETDGSESCWTEEGRGDECSVGIEGLGRAQRAP